jgi:hypothetical protein
MTVLTCNSQQALQMVTNLTETWNKIWQITYYEKAVTTQMSNNVYWKQKQKPNKHCNKQTNRFLTNLTKFIQISSFNCERPQYYNNFTEVLPTVRLELLQQYIYSKSKATCCCECRKCAVSNKTKPRTSSWCLMKWWWTSLKNLC